MAQLSVELSADLKKLEKALRDARKKLKDFGENVPDPKEIPDPTKKLNKGAANTTNTLLEFNRVIQDAPFGIQGVANNLQQLTSNFQQNIKDAGGFSQALGQIAKDFIGPAGILFVVSAATSLLVAYGDQLFKTTRLSKELADATKGFIGSAQAEISVLGELLSIARDETQTRERRAQAVQVLQDKFPQYLSNLTTENATTVKIEESVKRLITALEQRAKVQGAQSLISKKAEELFLKQTEAEEDYQNQLNQIPQTLASQQQAYNQYARGVNRALFNRDQAEASLQEKASQRLKTTLDEAEKEYQTYVQNLSKILAGAPNLLDAFGVTGGGGGRSLGGLTQVDGITRGITASLENLGPNVSSQIQAADLPGRVATELTNAELVALERSIEFGRALEQTLGGSIVQGISSAFAAIGNAIATGGNVIQAAGGALLGAIGNVAVNLGTLVIAQGVAIETLKKSLLSLTGAPAIAIGGALVALGSVFKAGASNLAGSFGGGGGASSFSSGSRSFTGASSSSFSSSAGGGEVVFEIAGTKLVGVLNRTLKKDRRTVADII